MRATGPTGAIRVVAGGSTTSLSCRFGATDWIEVRLNVTTTEPEGEYSLARLPRETTSTPVDRSLLGEGEVPVYDDAFLPIVGTPLHAKPAANSGAGRGFLVIDGTTLRPNA
jgi:hypothetical protein